MIENERKWLIEEDPSLSGGDLIKQFHLVVSENYDVRIRRRQDPEGQILRTQTIKKGTGRAREEYVTTIDTPQFFELKEAADGVVEKTRHEIEIGDHTAEIDIYKGELEGIVVAEVEDPEGFEPPEWFGKEITKDEHYKNKWLAVDGAP